MERDKVYTSIPPQYGFKCPKCGAFEYSTTPEYDDVIGDGAPDAVPASETRPIAEPKFKTGDHVWAKSAKELAGRTGYVLSVDTYRMMYDVKYDDEIWRVQEADLEKVDPATEDYKSPILEAEEKRERYIVHIDENYLQTLYVQNHAVSQEDRMEIYNKVYNEITDFIEGKADKSTTMAYDWVDEYGNPRHSWWVETIDGQWQSGKAFTKQKPAKPDVLTEEKVYDYYQERSTTAGDRADQLAWMFVVMMTGGLISGHAFQAFSVCASLAAVYMLLSVVQAVWQTFTSWLFKNRLKKMDVVPDDYPEWVGGGAWLFFWAKMITIASAVIYFVKAIFF